MEISPKRSLSLDFDTSVESSGASSYSSTCLNCQRNVYTSQGTKPVTDSKSARPFAITSSLSMDSDAKSMLAPKKENFISNIFNVLTSAVIDRFAKVPSSFMNNMNSTLSVTVVPNEGIISQDFFKSLTRSSEQLASEHHMENDTETVNTSEKLPSKLLYDLKSQMSYAFADKLPDKVSLDGHQEAKETAEESADNELIGKSTSSESQEKNDIISHDKHSKMENFTDEIVPVDESGSPTICRRDNHTQIKMPCTSSPGQSEVPAKKSISEGNCAPGWQKMWQSVVNDVSDHVDSREASPEPEVPTKKPNLAVHPHPKPRRKTCSVALGRGKGRGKSQLRKSGVSQSRHRKERTKQDIYSNIQDDLEAWEVSDSYDSGSEDPLQGIRENEEQKLSPCQETWKHGPTLFENFTHDETNKSRKRKQQNGSAECPMRVRYLPESAMDVDSCEPHDCLPKIGGFRPRLMSESSVDSEDSYSIVFESNSESESNTDYNCDSVSEEESDDDSESEDCNGDETTLRVRFNLEPRVHTMIKWNYAYRAARKGPWEEMARDRERFRGRIRCVERILEPILAPQHRKSVWQDRFHVDG